MQNFTALILGRKDIKIMTFETFLKHSLEPQEGTSLFALSKFKRENPLDYAKYRDRLKRTEDFYRRNANNEIQQGRISEPLTLENFSKYEGYVTAHDNMLGRDKPSISDSMKPMFDRLSQTEQQDLYYHCMLQGRVSKDGKAEYQQSDFDWLKSQDYQEVLEARKAKGIS